LSATKAAVTALQNFYGERSSGNGDPDSVDNFNGMCQSQAFFDLVAQFVGSLKRAAADVAQWKEQVRPI